MITANARFLNWQIVAAPAVCYLAAMQTSFRRSVRLAPGRARAGGLLCGIRPEAVLIGASHSPPAPTNLPPSRS